MSFLASIISLATGVTSSLFAVGVLRRYAGARRAPHLLLWGIGLVMYALGAYAQASYALAGFNGTMFRVWYLFGAMLVAAYLGQGSAYLLLPLRWAHRLTGLLVLGSLFAAYRVFGATVDPAQLSGQELTGAAIVSPGVRVLTPVFNLYGTLLLVGGAAWSTWRHHRRRDGYDRMLASLLIAVGALAPALGGTLNRFGLPGLYAGELVGSLLMYAGFLRASPARVPQANAVSSARTPAASSTSGR